MCRKICVTNRKLVQGDFLEQLSRALDKKPYAMILREKDLSEGEYERLAEKVMRLCENSETRLILHNFPEVAKRLKVDSLHMPLGAFLKMSREDKTFFRCLGVSTHSVEDAILAEQQGAGYIATDCKKGLPPRGLTFLHEVCEAVSIPVYAIGGITEENMSSCVEQGAAGVCMMSGYMV